MTDYKQIIWLASYPKSGNTWVRCFLDAYLMGDVDINEILCSVQDDMGLPHQVGDGSDVVKMPIDIQHLTRPMAMLRIVKQYLSSGMKSPLFVKTHSSNMLVNGLELFPLSLTKKIIFIVRDPRDVAPSFARHMGAEPETAVEWMQDKYRTLNASDSRVANFVGSWDAHARSFLNADAHPILTIKYEDLKSDPERWFTEILEYSGIKVDQGRVKKAIEKVDLAKLREQEDKEGFKESSPYSKDKFFGHTKEELSLKLKNRVVRKFGTTMKRLGYEL